MEPSYHIIIADDDTITCKFMTKIVEVTYPTASISPACDGAEALHIYGQRGADLLILDYSMPAMNGIDLARALRSARATLPIIMLSGDLNVAQQALAVGINVFISKPVRLSEFTEAATRLLPP